MSLSPKLFNTCVDSLDLRLYTPGQCTAELVALSTPWLRYQERSRVSGFALEQYSLEIPHIGSFTLHPTAKRPYAFLLKNPEIADIRIWSPAKWASAGSTGQIYVSFRSHFLQYQGLQGVQRFLLSLKEFLFGSTEDLPGAWCRCSRVDLAADISKAEGFRLDSLDAFVSRARYREQSLASTGLQAALDILDSSPPQPDNRGGSTYTFTEQEVNKIRLELFRSKNLSDSYDLSRTIGGVDLETFYFGRFNSPLFARIYNKSASLHKQEKDYMLDIWTSNGYQESDGDVWRVEFSISGAFLKSCVDLEHSARDPETGELLSDLRDFDTLVKIIPALWKYCTEDWLREVSPPDDSEGGDRNRWRWPPTEFWQVVQTAWVSAFSVVRTKPQRNLDPEALIAQLKGLVLSTLSIQMTSNDDFLPQYNLLETLASWFEGSDFLSSLLDRRILLGIDDISADILYSIGIRKEQMSLGLGS